MSKILLHMYEDLLVGQSVNNSKNEMENHPLNGIDMKKFMDYIEKLEKAGLVRVTSMVINGVTLNVADYTDKKNQMKSDTWSLLDRHVRGLLYTKGLKLNRIIGIPLPKFWAPHATETKFPESSECRLMQKMDGTCIYVVQDPEYGTLVWSRGSLKSKQAELAKEYLADIKLAPGVTYGCELIDPRDPKIEIIRCESGLYCFAAIGPDGKMLNYVTESEKAGFNHVPSTTNTISELCEMMVQNTTRTLDDFSQLVEGYVIEVDGILYKIKDIIYSLYCKLGIRITSDWIISYCKKSWNQDTTLKESLTDLIQEKVDGLNVQYESLKNSFLNSLLAYFDSVFTETSDRYQGTVRGEMKIANTIEITGSEYKTVGDFLLNYSDEPKNFPSSLRSLWNDDETRKNMMRSVGIHISIWQKIAVFGQEQTIAICNTRKIK